MIESSAPDPPIKVSSRGSGLLLVDDEGSVSVVLHEAKRDEMNGEICYCCSRRY